MNHTLPKGQHFIPRLHLKHFAGQDPKGQVWTFDKNSGASRSAVPEETAVQNHFYSVEQDDGTYDTGLEEFLASAESSASPVYENLIAGKVPAKDQKRADFAAFLAHMYVRTPAKRREAANMIGRYTQIINYAYASNDTAFETLTRDVEQEIGKPISPEDKQMIREMLIDPSTYRLRIPKEETFSALAAADKLVQIFFNMGWSVLRPRHGFFITSDNPVVRQVDPKTCHSIYGDQGFLNNTAQITFPLTPQALLILRWVENPAPSVTVEPERVDHLNGLRAYYADQFLYAHISNEKLKRLAKNLKGSRPQPTTEGFGPDKFTTTEFPRRWKGR